MKLVTPFILSYGLISSVGMAELTKDSPVTFPATGALPGE